MAKKRDIAGEDLMEAMIKVMNDPATPAEREFAERVDRTLMTMYHHYDDTKSARDVDEDDRAQIESALAQFAHLRSKESAPQGVRERHANERPEIEARDEKIYERVLELVRNDKSISTSDIVKSLKGEFGTERPRKDRLQDELDNRKLSEESLRKLGIKFKKKALAILK
jgi:hypothetical protein